MVSFHIHGVRVLHRIQKRNRKRCYAAKDTVQTNRTFFSLSNFLAKRRIMFSFYSFPSLVLFWHMDRSVSGPHTEHNRLTGCDYFWLALQNLKSWSNTVPNIYLTQNKQKIYRTKTETHTNEQVDANSRRLDSLLHTVSLLGILRINSMIIITWHKILLFVQNSTVCLKRLGIGDITEFQNNTLSLFRTG